MSRRWGQPLFATLAACLTLLSTVSAFAAEPAESTLPVLTACRDSGVEEPGDSGRTTEWPANTVFDETGLAQWLEQHKETGGTVFLGSRITITQYIGVYGITEELTVDTGAYGLVFDGGALSASNIFVIGEGVEMPVVEVLRAGSDSPWENSWNNSLLEMNITATGRNGEGGTALCISTADTKRFRPDILYAQGMIRSYGEGAVGLQLEVPMEAWCYRIEVFGDNSKAVYAPNGASLYFCKLTAEGESAASAQGSGLLLDSCDASPISPEIQRISRRMTEESFSRLYLPLKQNQIIDYSPLRMLYTPTVSFVDEDNSPIALSLIVEWNIDDYYDIDTSVFGETLISGALSPALSGLDAVEDVPIALTVEVRDPELPCIRQVVVRNLEEGTFAILSFWNSYDPADESVILWRSDDEGETWLDATHARDISWQGDCVYFTYDTLVRPVWFQLEAVGVGESNIIIMNEKDGVFIGGNGGDRTGTDRGGVNPPVGNGNISDAGGDASDDNDDDTVESPSRANGEANAPVTAVMPADTFPQDIVKEAIPAENQTAAPAPNKPEATPTQPENAEPEIPPVPEEDTEAAAAFDSGQSAPEPKFSPTVLAAFFLGTAGSCSAALLVFRFGRNGRWPYGKS